MYKEHMEKNSGKSKTLCGKMVRFWLILYGLTQHACYND